jgi:hypothetical protein
MTLSQIVIGLAGGLRPDATLPPHAEQRVKRSAELAREINAPILFSSSFTLNTPPVRDESGRIISEASAMAVAARAHGFEGEIYCEQQSHDTIGSAYFTFRNFIEDLRPDIIWLVTSAFHMPRSAVIFRHVASLFGYEAPALREVISDDTRNDDREYRENKSLGYYCENWLPIDSRARFARKLFTEHSLYNTEFRSSTFFNSPNMLY